MKSITFECEVITPMFLAGADGRTPELRPPSIKGAMRFWWRAVNGHLVKKKKDENGNEYWDYSKLKKEEAKIFGGSYKDENGKEVRLRSSFDLKVEIEDNIRYFNFLEEERNGRKFNNSIKYFAFTFFYHKQNKEKKALVTGTNFKVIISAYNEKILLNLADLFIIFSLLGGLGMRNRRGFGAFVINNIHSDNLNSAYNLSFNENIKKLSFFGEEYIDYDFQTINGIFKSKRKFTSWEKALNDIAYLMRQIRDHAGGATETEFTLDDLDKKAAFGLPIPIFGDKKNKLNLFDSEDNEYRRASQFIISIYKENNVYYWIVTLLNGKFKPDDYIIKYDEIIKFDKINYDLYNDFIDTLEQNAKFY